MAQKTFLLPDAGEGLTEAEVVRWMVAVGDEVRVNQPVIEVETAKSLVELPSPFDGVVARLLVQEGDTVQVGSPILDVTVEGTDGEDAPNGAATQSPETQEAAPQPLVGYGVAEESTPSRRRRGRETPSPTTPGGSKAQSAAGQPPAATPQAPTLPAGKPILAKPPVRKLARDLGVDLATIRATGPGGIVTREDVIAAQEEQSPAKLATYPSDDQPWLVGGHVSSDGRFTRVPVRSVRKRTAEAMVTSAFTAPHVTEFTTLDVTKTMKLVEKLKTDRDFQDVHVTPLLIVAKALLLAVQRHPEINASWDEDSQEIVYKHYVNLGIAAATPRGLVVPNIKDAHRMNVHELAQQLGILTQTARAGKTTPLDQADGTITITNVGVFGIDTGTPILNPGEAGILAMGAITQRPWAHKGKIKLRWVTELALSFDHRLVDGGLGSTVLADVARVLEDPAQALVWA